jgi:hypothetical protein
MRRVLITTGAIFIIPFVFNTTVCAVPVIANEAVLLGVVKECGMTKASLLGISPEQILYKLVISVRTIEDIKDYPNFLRGKEGQSIIFYLKAGQSSELFGKEVRAVVEYKGDERGGLFWIKNIDVVK